MFRFRKGTKKGYILIYVLLVNSLCLLIALGCYKMECLKTENSLKLQKIILKVDKLQKSKEYIFTELDDYICENIKYENEEDIKNYFNSSEDFKLTYEECIVNYNKDKNYFLVQYYSNNKFCKEEFYKYKLNGKSVIYSCIDYSYKEGVLK